MSAPCCNISASPPICSTRKGYHHPSTEEWHRFYYLGQLLLLNFGCGIKGKRFLTTGGGEGNTQYIIAPVCWPYKIIKFWQSNFSSGFLSLSLFLNHPSFLFPSPWQSLAIPHIKQLILSNARRSVDQSSTTAKVAKIWITLRGSSF